VSGLKIPRPQGCAGSTPAVRTKRLIKILIEESGAAKRFLRSRLAPLRRRRRSRNGPDQAAA